MTKPLIAIVGAVAAATGVALAPTAHANTSNWPMCGAFSLFSEDQCDAIEYCLNNDDPACDEALGEPSTVPPQQ